MTVTSDGHRGYRDVLRQVYFRRIWSVVLLSRLGEAIAQVAMPLLVYDLTGSSELLGLIFVLSMAPRVVLAPVAGLLIDRVDRRRLLLSAAIVRGVAAAAIPLTSDVWHVGALAVVISIGSAVSLPTELALLPAAVSKADLVPALSLVQVTNGTMRIAGPALGAALIGVSGTGIAFLAQASCFAATIVVLGTFQIPRVDALVRVGGVWQSIRTDLLDGLRVVWRTPIVRGATAVEGLWTLVGAAMTIAGVVLTAETLDLGDRAGLVYGLLSASMSAGAVTGALAAAPLSRRVGRPVLLGLGYLGPLAIVPVLTLPPVPVLFGCWFVFGVADALAVVAMHAYLAEAVADNQRGRMYASWNGLVTLAGLLSYATVGWLTERLGAAAMIGGTALLVGIGGPSLLLLTGALPDVRRQQRAEAVATSQL